MAMSRIRRLLGSVLGRDAALWVGLTPLVAFAAAFLQLSLSGVDPDYWWHLTSGRWMLDHGRIPTTDPFSFSHAGQNWYAHEWLSELVLAVVNRIAGYAGAIVLTAAVVAVAAWLLARAARYYGAGARAALLLVCGSGFFLLGNLAVRPQVWGWALLALLLHELAAYEAGCRRRLWHLPLLYALWINVHLSALMGGAALLLYVLHQGIRWLAARRCERAAGDLGHLVLVGVLSAVALCVNPRGLALLWFTRVYANQHAVRYRYIGEWQRPSFSGNDRWLFIGAGAIVLATAVVMLLRRSLWPGVLVILFAAAALRATRYVPLFAIVSIPALGWLLGRFRGRTSTTRKVAVPRALRLTLVAATGATIMFGVLAGGPSQLNRNPNAAIGGYPVEAADWVELHAPRARLFGEYGWGGYLIYRFYPRRLVYMDGREEMYGEPFFQRFVQTIGAEPGWQATLASAGIEATIIDLHGPLAQAMDADPGWQRVFSDGIAAIFVPVASDSVSKILPPRMEHTSW